ncbi:MAG TPA: cupredoxin domain-containing protein [Thermoanaerobaculia bacterium]|nr:cupredoxin domain-containing protein [Thermoanaerobaculia bacterium]
MKRTRILIGAALLVVVVPLSGRRGAAQPAPRVIAVTAKRFEFVPHELSLKKGEPVTIHLTSEDVEHGFFNRKLKIDADVPAGQSTDITITPEQEGDFLVICDHFCGAQHGNMHMSVKVE